MAKRWSTASSPPPTIARRRHGRRQTSTVDHVRVDLVNEKISERVQKLRNEEEMREGEKREAGVAEGVAGVEVYRRRCSGQLELGTSGLAA